MISAAVYPLMASAPAFHADMALGVEHQQRVVAHRLDEDAELFFTGTFSQDRRAFILGLGRHAPQDSRKSTMYL